MNQSTEIETIDTAHLPKTYEAAKKALAECENVDEVKEWADRAAALRAYAAQAEDEELERYSRRIRNRAIRRMGEIMTQIAPAPNHHGNSSGRSGEPTSRKAAADAIGISKSTRQRAQKVASIPEPEFDALNERPRPASVTEMVSHATGPKPASPAPTPFQDMVQIMAKLRLYIAQSDDFLRQLDEDQRDALASETEKTIVALRNAERAMGV